MDEHFPALTTLNIDEAQATLPEIADAVSRHETRVVLAQNGEPVAVIMSLLDLERVLDIQSKWQGLLDAQREMAAGFADVPVEEAEAEIDRIFREMRAADRAARELAAAG
jgi:prevent-host-death family protein